MNPQEHINEAATLISANFATPDTIEGRRAIVAINHLRMAVSLLNTKVIPSGSSTDGMRLDWLELMARKSRTGISFDWIPSCEGEPSGFRFMRRHHIGEPFKSIRQAIDSEMNAHPSEGGTVEPSSR